MWDLAVREDDYGAARAMVDRMTSPPLSMRLLLGVARGDTAERRAMFEQARVSDSRQSQIGARYIATFLEEMAVAESLARFDLAPRRRPEIRENAAHFLAWLDVARGRWDAANAAFARADDVPRAPPVVVQRALAAAMPFLEVQRADLERVTAEVAAWDPAAAASAPDADLAARLRPHLRLYLLGLLALRRGDADSALARAGELERLAAPPGTEGLATAMAQTVRADAALHAGDVGAAAAALEHTTPEIPLELVSVPLFANAREFTLEHARLLRVLVLSAQRNHREALRWSATGFQGSPAELVYLAPMHFLAGEMYEESGEAGRAVEHYRRFVRLWSDCDDALRPRVVEATRRIERLERERR